MIDLTFASLYALRDRLQALNADIRSALASRERILKARPHRDDIVEAYQLGVESIVRDHEERLAAFALDPRLADISAVVGPETPFYFMREQIARELPAIVDRLCPDAKRGMKLTDRRNALREADGSLSRLAGEREAVRLAMSAEQIKLRDQRQDAAWERDANARSTIESEERALMQEIAVVRRDQEQLHNVMGMTVV